MAASTIGNASSALRELCTENRQRLGITGDAKNAGDYEIFRIACKTARKAVKGRDPRYVSTNDMRGDRGDGRGL